MRCPHRIIGIFQVGGEHDGLFEVKCNSKKCKKEDSVVLHYFDPQSGALVDTVRFREPAALFHNSNRKR